MNQSLNQISPTLYLMKYLFFALIIVLLFSCEEKMETKVFAHNENHESEEELNNRSVFKDDFCTILSSAIKKAGLKFEVDSMNFMLNIYHNNDSCFFDIVEIITLPASKNFIAKEHFGNHLVGIYTDKKTECFQNIVNTNNLKDTLVPIEPDDLPPNDPIYWKYVIINDSPLKVKLLEQGFK